MVWFTDGSVEIHEVTLSERLLLPNAQRREQGARDYCDEKGYRYVIHTEGSLPNETETANLLELYAYRPRVYTNKDVALAVHEKLSGGRRMLLHLLMNEISQDLNLPAATVSGAIYHLMWHGKLDTDLRSLIFIDGVPTTRTCVWLPKEV